jgi:hypothetical protein
VQYYHFECDCLRCRGLKLSWLASEAFNPKLEPFLSQTHRVEDAVKGSRV